MTAQNFINEDSYLEIMESVRSKGDFEHRAEHKKYEVEIHSGYAGCDWRNGIKDGNYIVHCGFQKRYGDYCGSGCAYSINEFLEFSGTYQSLLDFIEKGLKHIGAEITEDVQMRLF